MILSTFPSGIDTSEMVALADRIEKLEAELQTAILPWASSRIYSENDFVMSGGTIYRSLQDGNGIRPVGNSNWWVKYGEDKFNSLIVTREVLNNGTFKNVSPAYLVNQVDGSDGFTITGVAKNSGATGGRAQLSSFLSWTYILDFTTINQIMFHARKNAGNGIAHVYVSNTSDDVVDGILAKLSVGYQALPTNWTRYVLDVSEISGKKYVWFVGGYTDNTGNASSSTSYCNIKFIG